MSDSITYKVTVSAYGDQQWYLDDKCHRVDGPAALYQNGTQQWYIDGKLHRVDGPAVLYQNGTQQWWLDGKCHRVDGPAILWADGTQLWYLDGKHMTEAEHVRLTQKPVVDDCVGRVVEIDGKKYKLTLTED